MRARPKPARRPRRWPRFTRPSPRALKLGGIALACIVAATPVVYLARTGVPAPVREAYGSAAAAALAHSVHVGLSVQEIFVEGRIETSAAAVLDVLDLSRGTPILSFDPQKAREELERLPWIKNAAVERRLPDTVYVRLIERRPLALWQRHGRIALIGDDGREIEGAPIERFAQLPMVVGDDAPQHAASLLALLQTEPELQRRVVAAVRVGDRRWNLRVDAGADRTIEVQLPEINPAAAWARLAEAVHASSLFEKNVTAVDLRLPDRLVVRVIREAPPAAPAKRGKTEKKAT
jgi:cell division protein FtsQ